MRWCSYLKYLTLKPVKIEYWKIKVTTMVTNVCVGVNFNSV